MKLVSPLFADDILLMSSAPSGLQNQINNLEKELKSLGLTVNLNKTKLIIFRTGGHISVGEKWFYNAAENEVVNGYKYLGHTSTTKVLTTFAVEANASKAKRNFLDLRRTM